MRNPGILNDPNIQQPFLLDAIRHAETGHLSPAKAAVATSKVGARGAYQFMPKNLHSMGYKMPNNIPLSDVLDPAKARSLAGQYVTGYSNYHGFTTPLQKLAAYNMGPQATENWLARGGKFEDLPDETQQYVTRAAKFMENKMALPKNSIAVGLDTSVDAVAARRAELTEQLRAARVPESAIPQMVAEMLAAETPALSSGTRTTGALGGLDTSGTEGLLQIGLDNAAKADAANARGIPDESGAAVNIDNTAVDDSALLNQAVVAADKAVTTGPNAVPYSKRPSTIYPMDHSAGILNPSAFDTQYPMDHSAGVLNPDPMVDADDMTSAAAAANSAVPVVNATTDDAFFNQQRGQTQYPIDHSSGILNPEPPAPTTGALSTENQSILRNAQAASAAKASEGRRNATGLTTMPTASIDGSDLIRIGSAMVGGSARGGLNAIDRAGQEYGAIMDAKGSAALERYKADMDAAQKNQVKDNNAAKVSSRIVTTTIDDIIPIINDDIDGLFNKVTGMGGNTTGFFGKIMAGIGGTEANDLRTMLDTVRANVGFDKLQSMREASPTGGALGNVSNQENLLLQSVLSNVEQSQSPEQLKRNLLRLRESYLDIVHGIGNRPYGTPKFSGSSGGSQTINGVTVTKVTP